VDPQFYHEFSYFEKPINLMYGSTNATNLFVMRTWSRGMKPFQGRSKGDRARANMGNVLLMNQHIVWVSNVVFCSLNANALLLTVPIITGDAWWLYYVSILRLTEGRRTYQHRSQLDTTGCQTRRRPWSQVSSPIVGKGAFTGEPRWITFRPRCRSLLTLYNQAQFD
jgi:hypothetical protein